MEKPRKSLGGLVNMQIMGLGVASSFALQESNTARIFQTMGVELASLPILMLAHQPKQVTQSASAGVDLQLAGHTHGGQIWPFNLLVKLDQPSVHGLTRHGDRTQLYTSRGTGFWGPPFRVFAPSEITVLTLHSA